MFVRRSLIIVGMVVVATANNAFLSASDNVESLSCDQCIRSGFTFCIQDPADPHTQRKCCQDSTCAETSNDNWVCSNVFESPILARQLCPTNSARCDELKQLLLDNALDQSEIESEIGPGETCIFEMKTGCGNSEIDFSGFEAQGIDVQIVQVEPLATHGSRKLSAIVTPTTAAKPATAVPATSTSASTSSSAKSAATNSTNQSQPAQPASQQNGPQPGPQPGQNGPAQPLPLNGTKPLNGTQQQNGSAPIPPQNASPPVINGSAPKPPQNQTIPQGGPQPGSQPPLPPQNVTNGTLIPPQNGTKPINGSIPPLQPQNGTNGTQGPPQLPGAQPPLPPKNGTNGTLPGPQPGQPGPQNGQQPPLAPQNGSQPNSNSSKLQQNGTQPISPAQNGSQNGNPPQGGPLLPQNGAQQNNSQPAKNTSNGTSTLPAPEQNATKPSAPQPSGQNSNAPGPAPSSQNSGSSASKPAPLPPKRLLQSQCVPRDNIIVITNTNQSHSSRGWKAWLKAAGLV